MVLLYKLISFSVINYLGIPSSELQTKFGVLQVDTENFASWIYSFSPSEIFLLATVLTIRYQRILEDLAGEIPLNKLFLRIEKQNLVGASF